MSEQDTPSLVTDNLRPQPQAPDLDDLRDRVINAAMQWHDTRALASHQVRELARAALYDATEALDAAEKRT